MTLGTNAVIISNGSRQRPKLTVVSNLGAGGTPDILIGRDPMTIQTTGIHISQGNSSPQITITEALWAACAGPTLTNSQQVAVVEQQL